MYLCFNKENIFFKSKYKKVAIILTVFVIIYYNIYAKSKVNINDYIESRRDISENKTNISNETVTFNNSNCNPINKNASNFFVVINNVTYPRYLPMQYNNSYNFECMNQDKRPKLILFWNEYFGRADFAYGLGKYTPFINNNCPVHNCELTDNKSRIEESDMVVFHMRDPIKTLPNRFNSQQLWTFMLFESPIHSRNYEKYNGLFNLSSTYRLDSNFTSMYYINSDLKWQENEVFEINQDFTQNKTDFAAIIVSNCHAKKRMDYIKALKQHIKVDVYGKCGKNCPGNKLCKSLIGNNYKFYLAFENSICRDYITEKFFDILEYNIIPVVQGGGPYDFYIPKEGYIDASDFKAPKDLANYLLYLDSNKTAYNSYFKWKRNIVHNIIPQYNSHICEYCIHLNLNLQFGIKYSVINDMKSFWTNKDCVV